MNQLQTFRATIEHQSHPEFLYYCRFTPDLEQRIRAKYQLDGEADLREYFGMFNPKYIQPKAPDGLDTPDFSISYNDIEKPENSFYNELGVLEIPGGEYHFTRYISPLGKVDKFEYLEMFPYPDFSDYTVDHMAAEAKAAHNQGRVAIGWGGHMYEHAWQIR